MLCRLYLLFHQIHIQLSGLDPWPELANSVSPSRKRPRCKSTPTLRARSAKNIKPTRHNARRILILLVLNYTFVSFITQRDDRIQRRGFVGRIESKENSDHRTDPEGEED